MAAVGSLLVRIGADTGGLRRGGRQAESTIRRLERTAGRASGRMLKLGSAAGIAGVALTAELTRRGLKAVDAQAKLSRTLDTTIGELRALQLAASDSGISAEQLEQNLTALNRRLGQAQQGTGQARRALEQLNLSAERLGQMSLTDRVIAISEAMERAGPAINKTAIAADLMSRSGISMLNMMEGGAEQIRAARSEVESFGLALSEVDAAQVEAANDAMDRIGMAIESISQSLAVEFAPLIAGVAEKLSQAMSNSEGFRDEISELIDVGVTAFGTMANSVVDLRRSLKEARVVALEFRYALNRIAGLGKTKAEMERMRAAVIHARQELQRMAGMEMPLDRMRGWVEEARRLSQQAAEDVVADRETEKEESERLARAQERARLEALEKARQKEAESRRRSLETLREHLQTAKQAEQERYRERLNLIKSATDQELEALGGRNAAIEKLERQHNERLKEIAGPDSGLSEAQKAQRQAAIDNLRSYLRSEYESEVEQKNRRMELIQSATEQELELLGGRQKAIEQLNQQHQNRLNQQVRQGTHTRRQFEEASMSAQAASVAGNLQRMTASVSAENKKMFKIQKAASIAMATINTYEGVSKALAAYPPPLSFAMAAAQLAAGMAQVKQISSQTFGGNGGGGGTAGGSGLGGGASAAGGGAGGGGAPADTGPATIVHLEGEAFGRQQVRDLLEQINEDSRDGGRIQVSG